MRRLLVLGADTPALQRVVPLLLRSDFQVYRVESAGEAVRLFRESRFDLIIARYPLADLPLATLVVALRANGSPSRSAGLLVLADPASMGDLASLIGRGVNRVVNLDGPSDRLLLAVADLVAVAPRRTVRTVVQLELWIRREAQRLLTLTENLSVSGMLVRGGREYPVDSLVSFELMLPGGEGVVGGTANVVRHTMVGVERVDGVGMSFVSLAGDGQWRLADFLERRGGG